MPDEKGSDRGSVSQKEYDRMEQLHMNSIGVKLSFEMGEEGVGCARVLER